MADEERNKSLVHHNSQEDRYF